MTAGAEESVAPYRPAGSSSSGVLWRARTRRLYSSMSLSQSSAAWPLSGLELIVVSLFKFSLRLCVYSLVGLSKQALQAQQHRADIVDSAPLVLEDVQADAAAEVDVGVVDGRLEEDGGRRVGIVGAELHAELEDEGLVGGGRGTIDGGSPACHVLVIGEGRDALGRLHHDVHELLLEAATEYQLAMAASRHLTKRTVWPPTALLRHRSYGFRWRVPLCLCFEFGAGICTNNKKPRFVGGTSSVELTGKCRGEVQERAEGKRVDVL